MELILVAMSLSGIETLVFLEFAFAYLVWIILESLNKEDSDNDDEDNYDDGGLLVRYPLNS